MPNLEKLAQLGLNEREAEEFIIYWLPKMQNNPYSLSPQLLPEAPARNGFTVVEWGGSEIAK